MKLDLQTKQASKLTQLFLLTYHETTHTLFLNTLILFLLFPLCVGVVSHDCLVKFDDLMLYAAMVFLEVLGMLQHCVQIFLLIKNNNQHCLNIGTVFSMRKETSIEKQIIQGTVEGRRGRGRPITSWRDSINAVTGSLAVSTRRAADRDGWPALIMATAAPKGAIWPALMKATAAPKGAT